MSRFNYEALVAQRQREAEMRADSTPLTRDEITDVERLIQQDDAEWGWFLRYVPRLLAEVKAGRFMTTDSTVE